MGIWRVKDRIKELEALAMGLEPDESERRRLLSKVTAYAEDFIQSIAKRPAYRHKAASDRKLESFPISKKGIGLDATLRLIEGCVDFPGINPVSERFLGYIPGGGVYHAALGDYLAAVSNRYAGVYYAGPGAVRMENMLLAWMVNLVGYPGSAGGNLTSGGSPAHLMAVVTARDAHAIEGEKVANSVVYLTEQTHHSVGKALRTAGLRKCVQRVIPVDQHFRMRVDALSGAVRADRSLGLRPWLVVASAGTTNTGSIDPLQEIADVAQKNELWFHLDGAYGAFFALCDEGKKKLAGMESSDSMIMDPHKTLFLPYGIGAVLVKNANGLIASFRDWADYMEDTSTIEPGEISPSDVSFELTKHFRGMRMWFPLMVLGTEAFRAALEEKLLLARYEHERLQAIHGVEVGPPPDLAVVVFRYRPERGDADRFNQLLLQSLQDEGDVFLSSTRLNGELVLRMAIGVYRTHLATVDYALDVLAAHAEKLAES